MRLPKFRLGLRFKITAYISVIVVSTAVVLGWFLVRRSVQETAEHLKEKGAVLGRNIASASEYGVLTGDESIFDSIISGLVKEKDVAYCIIYDDKGQPLVHTPVLPRHIEGISPAAAYEVTEKALKTNELLIQPFTEDETRTPVYDIAAPIITQKTSSLSGEEIIFGLADKPRSEEIQERIGVARIGISLDAMNKEINEARRTVIKVTAIVVLLAIGLTIFLVRLIVDPVQQLVDATERVASGDLDKPVQVMTNDEIGELGVSFNKMIAVLKRYRTELEGYSKTLQNKVEERTKALRLTNEELFKTNQQLEAVSKLKSEFLMNMSHELRTPLNAIIGFSEILRDQSFGELNERQLKYAQNIVVSGKHLLQLINEILDLAKVESGKTELQFETFPVAGFIAEIVNFARGLGLKKDITVRERLSPKLESVTADRKKLKQIFYNLVGNAIKFTPNNGWVEISTDVVGDFETSNVEEIVFRRYGEFCVRDNGIGIDKEDQERVFQEFQQVDGSQARQFEGAGLGLALTKKLVELHGGSIWVESEKGKGSAFYLTLPITDENIVEPEKEAEPAEDEKIIPAPAPDDKERERVLVVEDDERAFELISTYLEEAGYEVSHATTGREAVRAAHLAQPVLILLDVILPDKDGWTVLQQLKSSTETAHIPVIITSMLQDEETGRRLGAADYIVKPVGRKVLLERIEKLKWATARERITSVLVVDDERDFVELLCSMLEAESFSVSRAYSGLEGIEFASKNKPDFIFLDLMLPDISGFEVVEFLKMDANTKDIPIVIVTAKELTDEEKQSLDGKIEALAKKGDYTRADFLDEIRRVERLAITRKGVAVK
jgi:signal transduction histidine kinase/DNA-binding response OmpR family regulator